ncbi:MAG: 4Fe-4S cluster-binding domain-containing protein [Spirochaetales bacterium]|nr:4Fe-4S cluster-binding domain-containing protein [Spirochaetales bacterium]
MTFQIIEKFVTISGEAPIPGTPVYLIRFAGCNLNCRYCDVPYTDRITVTLSENELYDDILIHLKKYPFLKILLTGGEPLKEERQAALFRVISKLKSSTHVYIETNGSIHIDFFPEYAHFVCDWKTPSSGEEKSFHYENIKTLRPEKDSIKFVVTEKDFEWVKEKIEILQKVNPRLPVYFSPQWGKLNFKDLALFILKNRLPGIMSLQLHKMIWVNEKEGIENGAII